MKCRMKRVASLFLALALCAGMTMNVGAVTVQEAENKADELEGKKEQAEAERKRAEREIEIIYEKYAPYLKYDVKRRIKNRQFKKRKRLERKNRPPRPYIPPQRTAEEQNAIDTEMKRLYKEYHVSAVGRMARHLKEKYSKQ